MRFYKGYCNNCKREVLMLEKLIDPKDCNCKEIENVCQYCKESK